RRRADFTSVSLCLCGSLPLLFMPPVHFRFCQTRITNVFTLSGKKALVTGASGGIGGAIAQGLARQGAEVALSGTRVDALEAAAKEIPGKTHIVPCDLGDT